MAEQMEKAEPTDSKGPEKSKKSSKNWFRRHKVMTSILVIGLIVVLSKAFGGGGSSPTTATTANTSDTSTQGQPSSSTSNAPATPATRQVKGTAVTLGAGTFTGGQDVAAGLYDVTAAAGQSGNFIVNGTDSYNEILGSDSSMNEVPKVRVQISSSDKIQISGMSSVTFTPVTSAFVAGHMTVGLYAGTFVVGQDIGAGKYVATPGSGQSGNFIVNGDDSYNEILGSDTSMDEVPSLTITLSKGDVVSISGMNQVTMTAQ